MQQFLTSTSKFIKPFLNKRDLRSRCCHLPASFVHKLNLRQRRTILFNVFGLFSFFSFNFFNLLGLFSLAALSASAYAQSEVVLRAAVASNFAASAKQLSAPFEKQYNLKIHWISGASGALYQQIRHGAPFDLFFSADREHPERLADSGFIKQTTLAPYAIGQLAIYAAKNPALTPQAIINKDFVAKRIAIANPVTAPYGKAAQAWLTEHELWQQYRKSAIVGNNVNQTFQQTHSGAVDWGLVAVSQLVAHQLPVQQVTLTSPEMLTQYVGVLSASKQPALSSKLIAFFTHTEQQEKLASLGYLPIDALSNPAQLPQDIPSAIRHD
ncbi:molybdate ABC transporter substrate-binding protein [Thalassotalea euphylliae]|uniref:Molybdate ABC transporter substrate-binding protein n=1 Tax=Thalassotalea euphylliae TaxID=1655234 RepID=A0A3E0UEL4_9GAMM|nr:molybdate ABC transporter substrate-binding protein [Thalassotalea euphylliae]REL34555.1 molybdate ABC transporter substrate-binding protein [Thalassotalea euphylliae]